MCFELVDFLLLNVRQIENVRGIKTMHKLNVWEYTAQSGYEKGQKSQGFKHTIDSVWLTEHKALHRWTNFIIHMFHNGRFFPVQVHTFSIHDF